MMSYEELERIKKVIDMPLFDKINIINSYVSVNNIKLDRINIEEVVGHIGKETMINHVYLKISKPHLVAKE